MNGYLNVCVCIENSNKTRHQDVITLWELKCPSQDGVCGVLTVLERATSLGYIVACSCFLFRQPGENQAMEDNVGYVISHRSVGEVF